MQRSRTQTMAARLPLRSDLNLPRKIWHSCVGIVILLVYYTMGMNRWTGSIVLTSLLIFCLFMESYRLRNASVNYALARFFSPIMRSSELREMSGIPAYLGGALVSILIFPEPVAVASILCLAFSDPMASLVGILFGHKTMRYSNGKSLAGTMAGVLTCAAVLIGVFGPMGLSALSFISIVLMGSIAGGTVELLPLEIDDNFSIPVLTGFTVWLAYLLTSGL